MQPGYALTIWGSALSTLWSVTFQPRASNQPATAAAMRCSLPEMLSMLIRASARWMTALGSVSSKAAMSAIASTSFLGSSATAAKLWRPPPRTRWPRKRGTCQGNLKQADEGTLQSLALYGPPGFSSAYLRSPRATTRAAGIRRETRRPLNVVMERSCRVAPLQRPALPALLTRHQRPQHEKQL
jgi:hypothetical protein